MFKFKFNLKFNLIHPKFNITLAYFQMFKLKFKFNQKFNLNVNLKS